MGTKSDFYQQFLDLSEEERMNLCKNSINALMEYFEERGYLDDNQDFALSFFTSLIGFFIGADTKVTPNETKIFNEIFGVNYTPADLAKFLPGLLTPENFMALDEFIDGMSEDLKRYSCFIILAVISADGDISEREEGLFERIFA